MMITMMIIMTKTGKEGEGKRNKPVLHYHVVVQTNNNNIRTCARVYHITIARTWPCAHT